MILDKDIPISPAEWQAWKSHPLTQVVLDALAAERSVWVQMVAFGDTLVNKGSEIVETAKAVGTVMGLTIILEDFELKLQQQWEEATELKREKEGEEENE